MQLISDIERIFTTALVLLPSSSVNRVYAVELREIWRRWLNENTHLAPASFERKSLVDLSVDAEIAHILEAMPWKTELQSTEYATPQFSREVYTIFLDTEPVFSETRMFSNMGGCFSR